MSIELVRVTEDNYPEFMDMIKWRITGEQVSKESYTSEDLQYGQCLSTDYFWVFTAKIDGLMVGYISASLIPKPDKRKGTLFIDEVWTQPSYRGKGIATILVDQMIKVGKEIDVWEVRLTVDIDNPAARKVYTNAGFKEKECIFGRLNLWEKK